MLNKTKQLTLFNIPEFKDLVEQHMLFINRFQQSPHPFYFYIF
jgi:hypothetical protein